MLDVGGRNQFDVGQAGLGGRQPAERVDQAPSAVSACAAAQSDDDPARACLQCRVDQLAHPRAVRFARRLHRGPIGQQSQPAGLGAFDVRRVRCGVEHPLCGDLIGEWARHPNRTTVAESAGQDVDEARAPVGLWGEGEHVAGTAAPPAGCDGPCGLHRGEAVAKAVGGDQHPQRPARHSSRVCRRNRRCMPGSAHTEVTWVT
jgi:hypothetical protein